MKFQVKFENFVKIVKKIPIFLFSNDKLQLYYIIIAKNC